ncbi:MAG: preprotein translocase subunit SecG [Bryobacterales bacterium]|nr:preprotein translocase subunit SecG [Bryobacterales bacterium]
MSVILTIVHVIVCLFLVVVVLLQSGKAADLAGAFGGMGSQTVFGPRGAATALSRATTASAVLFMVTSLGLSVIATRQSGSAGGGAKSVLESVKDPGAAPTPTAPGSVPPPLAPAGGAAQPTVELLDPTTGKVVSKQPLELPPPPAAGQKQEQKK